MVLRYKKLRERRIDRNIKKKDLDKTAGVGNHVISQINRIENITVETVVKICKAPRYTPNDMM